MKRLLRQLNLSLSSFLWLLLFTSSYATESWIASPARAAAVQRKIPEFAGRDFWLLLDPQWHRLEGVKNEDFVKDSGLAHIKLPFRKENIQPPRVLLLRELEIYRNNVRQEFKKEVEIRLIPAESTTEILYPEKLYDDDSKTGCVVSADPRPVKQRYREVKVTLQLLFRERRPLEKLIIRHGSTDNNGRLKSVRFLLEGQEVKPVSYSNQNGVLTAEFQDIPEVGKVTLECTSEPVLIRLLELPPDLAEHCRKYPFTAPFLYFTSGGVLGLTPENFDRESFQKFLQKYENTFMGFYLPEWDSNYFQVWKRPKAAIYQDLLAYAQPAGNRIEAEKNLRTVWDLLKSIYFNRVWGLSGQLDFPQYGMEYGGKIAGMELAGNSAEFPHRTNLLFAVGAAHQYQRPWLMYLAYYAGYGNADTRGTPKVGENQWFSGEDRGIAPSLGRRLLFLSYYMGTSFLDFESQPWGQVRKNRDGSHSLTANGRAVKEIYQWSKQPEGKRGTFYTPVLLLLDYHHGHSEWQRGRDWKVWYYLPMEKSDCMIEHFLRTINPYLDNHFDWGKAPFSPNLRNSSLGDIFDVAFANPPSETKPHLKDYPAVILASDLRITPAMAADYQRYVAEGGTLVINSIHANAFPKELLGAELLSKTVEDDDLQITRLRLNKATVLLKSSGGHPLAVKHPFGRGNLILTTSPYWLGKEAKKNSPHLAKMLEQIQAEVLPFQISGDIQFLLNRMPGDAWKLVLINNKGILKKPEDQTEKADPDYTATVTLTLPATVEAVERLNRAPIGRTVTGNKQKLSLKVPPGEIRVIDLHRLTFDHSAPTADLLGWWSLDGDNRDRSGHERNCLIHQARFVPGRFGQALQFRNDQDCVRITFPLASPLYEGTYEVWAAPDLQSRWQTGGGLKRGEVINTESLMIHLVNDTWAAMVYDGVNVMSLRNGPKAEHGKWTHLVLTWSGFQARFYVNGREVVNEFGPLKFCSNVGNGFHGINTVVGARVPGSLPFRGKIDEIKLYGRALTPEEVLNHFQAASTR